MTSFLQGRRYTLKLQDLSGIRTHDDHSLLSLEHPVSFLLENASKCDLPKYLQILMLYLSKITIFFSPLARHKNAFALWQYKTFMYFDKITKCYKRQNTSRQIKSCATVISGFVKYVHTIFMNSSGIRSIYASCTSQHNLLCEYWSTYSIFI